MKTRKLGWIAVVGVFLVTGCTTYHVRVKSYPPVPAEITLDGESVGKISDQGEGSFTAKKSIFAKPLLEVKNGDKTASMALDFASAGVRLDNVVTAICRRVGNDRHYNVTVAWVTNPLPPYNDQMSGGSSRLQVLNTCNEEVYWVGLRSRESTWLGKEYDAGSDYLVFEGESEVISLSKGTYQVFVAPASEPGAVPRSIEIDVNAPNCSVRISRNESGECAVAELD